VEFALVVPVFVYMLLAATDLGLSLLRKTQVMNAARAGAEYATLHGFDSTAITSAATAAVSLSVSVTPTSYCGCASGNAIVQQACGTSCTGGGTTGSYASVSTSATYTPVSPVNWGSSSTQLTVTAVARTN
jgi:Flp pilus assembly protein TadG